MPEKLIEIVGFLLGTSLQGNRKNDGFLAVVVPRIIQTIVVILVILYSIKATVNVSTTEINELKLWKSECVKEQSELKIADATMKSDIANQYREIINRLDAIQFNRNSRRQ